MADELAAKRKVKRDATRPQRIAKILRDLLNGHERDQFEEGELKGLVVVRLFDSGPVVNCISVTTDNLRAAASAIQDLADPSRVRFREENARLLRERMERYEKAHPFPCSHPECRKRFDTDRGRKIHERSCWHIRRDREAERAGGTG